MQSTAPDVTAYLEQLPTERRAAIAALRQLCVATLEGYAEGMQYGMPSYAKDGVVEVAFASQKNYISLYILKQAVLDAHRDALRGLNVGKGCIRYRRPAQLDLAVIARLLADTHTSSEGLC
jgi:uncharacterized protein YdhG (YjbR/CyaY superfamily)